MSVKTTKVVPVPLQEGTDYELNEVGLMVFTAHYLKQRGYCCRNGCRNCPYNFHQSPAENKDTQPRDTTQM